MKGLGDLHFVSFDTALLLEEAGYSEESLVVYKYNTQTKDGAELTCLGSPKKNIKLKKYSTVAAITLDEACDFIKNQYMYVLVVEPKYTQSLYSQSLVSDSISNQENKYNLPSKNKQGGVSITWTTYLRDERALNSPFNMIAKNIDKYAALDEGINIFLRLYILDKQEIIVTKPLQSVTD
jgi:hypothetical protein